MSIQAFEKRRSRWRNGCSPMSLNDDETIDSVAYEPHMRSLLLSFLGRGVLRRRSRSDPAERYMSSHLPSLD